MFELSPGVLNDDAPQVWGCPRWSDEVKVWCVDWYAADGTLEGVTLATVRQIEWIARNPSDVGTMQADVARWRDGLRSPVVAKVNAIQEQWTAGASDPKSVNKSVPGAMDGYCTRCGSGKGKCFCL